MTVIAIISSVIGYKCSINIPHIKLQRDTVIQVKYIDIQV